MAGFPRWMSGRELCTHKHASVCVSVSVCMIVHIVMVVTAHTGIFQRTRPSMFFCFVLLRFAPLSTGLSHLGHTGSSCVVAYGPAAQMHRCLQQIQKWDSQCQRKVGYPYPTQPPSSPTKQMTVACFAIFALFCQLDGKTFHARAK